MIQHPFFETLIRTDQLADLVTQTEVVILDCRFWLMDKTKGRKEYLAGHIPGAYYLDPEQDLSSPQIPGVTGRHPLPHPEIIASAFRAAGINSNTQVVAYDQSTGAFAARAWWLLRWLGHPRVAVLDGGFTAWAHEGRTTDNQWYPPAHGTLQVQLRQEMTLDRQKVAALSSGVYDSRDYKRFTGETEPIDPVAGHIPGAVCLPHVENNLESGMWKSEEALRQRFKDVLPSDAGQPVFYCGSGLTACHNILAYKIATGHDALLYPGSWSEWIHYYPAETGG